MKNCILKFLVGVSAVLALISLPAQNANAEQFNPAECNMPSGKIYTNPEIYVVIYATNLDASFNGIMPTFEVNLKNLDTGAESHGTMQSGHDIFLGYQPAGNYYLEIYNDSMRAEPLEFYNGCGGRTVLTQRIDMTGIQKREPMPNISDSDFAFILKAFYEGLLETVVNGGGSTPPPTSATSQVTVRVREGLRTEGAPEYVADAQVTFTGSTGRVVTGRTSANGTVTLAVPQGNKSIKIRKTKYYEAEEAIVVATTAQTKEITLFPSAQDVEKIYRTIIFDKVGGLGNIYGAYGNPLCPSLTPNHCTSVVENGRNITYTVDAAPGYQFTGFSGDSGCQYLYGPHNNNQLFQIATDLHCQANFTAGTASPRSCLPAGSGCGLENGNGLVGYTCESCCDYTPSSPYNKIWEFGEYHYYCGGTAVSPTSANIVLSSASVASGQNFTVNFLNSLPATTTDWIGIYPVGFPDVFYGVPTPNNAPIIFFYASNCSNIASSPARQSGSCSVQAQQPGTYEVRMFHNNHFVRIGTSPQLTVVTPPPPTVLTSSGNQSTFSNTGDVVTFTTPGLYTITVNNPVTVSFKGAAGGGKGGESWSSSTTVGASGGAAGAVTRGTTLTLVPNHNYSLVVGAGGATGAQAEGQATTLIDTTDSVILVSLGGGGGGLTGQNRGAGGIASIGSNKIDGGFGGYGGINWNSGETGVAGSLNGAAGGGGGGGYDEFGRPGGIGGSAGPGVYGSSGGSGNGTFGGGGGNGAPATFTEVTGNFGYGGGGAGARSGTGGNGGNGVGIFVRVAQ